MQPKLFREALFKRSANFLVSSDPLSRSKLSGEAQLHAFIKEIGVHIMMCYARGAGQKQI